jgi:hypothetical protein
MNTVAAQGNWMTEKSYIEDGIMSVWKLELTYMYVHRDVRSNAAKQFVQEKRKMVLIQKMYGKNKSIM